MDVVVVGAPTPLARLALCPPARPTLHTPARLALCAPARLIFVCGGQVGGGMGGLRDPIPEVGVS